MAALKREAVMPDTSLELLQAMVERVLTGQRRMESKLDRIVDDLADLKLRTTSTEEAVAGVNRRLDRLDLRVERIERRLDLVDAGT
jgi:chaperonin cofactor prefoldin